MGKMKDINTRLGNLEQSLGLLWNIVENLEERQKALLEVLEDTIRGCGKLHEKLQELEE